MKQSIQQVYETRLKSIKRKDNREKKLQDKLCYALQYREKHESKYILRSSILREDIKNYDTTTAKIDFTSLFDELDSDFNFGLNGAMFLENIKSIKDIDDKLSGVYLL